MDFFFTQKHKMLQNGRGDVCEKVIISKISKIKVDENFYDQQTNKQWFGLAFIDFFISHLLAIRKQQQLVKLNNRY